MSKICIVGDTHFGMRSDNIHFHNLYAKFYNEVMFPFLRENGIEIIVQLGDLFDRRKFINFQSLYLSKKYFFNDVNKDFKLYTIIGNHDATYKNTIDVNSSSLLLNEYSNIKVYSEPVTQSFYGVDADFIPWICKDNEDKIYDFIKNSKSKICFGHFELSGFEMDRGNVCLEGMDRDILQKYDLVLSGHFHHKSSDGQIVYVGTPGEMTWADYDDERGFHILDLNDLSLEFVENPHKMFHKIIYDETQETLEKIQEKDFSKYKDKIVKVIVSNKTNPYMFDVFFDKLYQSSPLDVSIVEDFVDYSEISEEDVIDEAEDTMTILDKYIDSLETNLDSMRIKNLMREIYNEAQSLEV